MNFIVAITLRVFEYDICSTINDWVVSGAASYRDIFTGVIPDWIVPCATVNRNIWAVAVIAVPVVNNVVARVAEDCSFRSAIVNGVVICARVDWNVLAVVLDVIFSRASYDCNFHTIIVDGISPCAAIDWAVIAFVDDSIVAALRVYRNFGADVFKGVIVSRARD